MIMRANGDKPHRCPVCHCIPNELWEPESHTQWYRIYRCDRGCENVRWNIWWSDWPIVDRLATKIRRRFDRFN